MVGHCRKKFQTLFQEYLFLLLYVKSGARLFALHGSDGDPASRVVVDHPVILVPEHVLRWQEGVLKDADERYESAFFYPVLVR